MGDAQAPSFLARWADRGRSHARYLWIIGLAVYIGAVWYIGWRAVADSLLSIHFGWLAALILVDFGVVWSRAAKWRIALGRANDAIPLFFLSKLGGNYSPGRIGEFAPMLVRRHRTPKVAGWVVTDRLLEMAATLGLGLVGFAAIRYTNLAVYAAWAGVVLLLVIAPVYVLTRRRLFLRIAALVPEGGLIHRLAMLAAAMREEILQLRPKLPLLSAMTVAATALDVVIGMILLRCFGYAVPFGLLAATQCLHALVSAVPITPNATGVPYAAAAVLLHETAGIPYDVLIAAVSLRFAAVNVNFWTCFGLFAPDLRRPATEPSTSP